MTLSEKLADYAAYLECAPEKFAFSVRAAHPRASDRTTVIFSPQGHADIEHLRKDGKVVSVRLYRWENSEGQHWAMGYEPSDDVLYIYDER
jgi:hypothetical protein